MDVNLSKLQETVKEEHGLLQSMWSRRVRFIALASGVPIESNPGLEAVCPSHPQCWWEEEHCCREEGES